MFKSRLLAVAALLLMMPAGAAGSETFGDTDLRAAYCAYVLGEQRKIVLEEAAPAEAVQKQLAAIDARRARLERHLARIGEGGEALRAQGRRQALEDLFELLGRGAQAKCFGEGGQAQDACLRRILRRTGMDERKAACDDLAWLPESAERR